MSKIEVLNRDVQIFSIKENDYICITDIARYKDAVRTDYLISNWQSNFWVSEKRSITRFLIPSNSMGLKKIPVSTVSS